MKQIIAAFFPLYVALARVGIAGSKHTVAL